MPTKKSLAQQLKLRPLGPIARLIPRFRCRGRLYLECSKGPPVSLYSVPAGRIHQGMADGSGWFGVSCPRGDEKCARCPGLQPYWQSLADMLRHQGEAPAAGESQ